MEAYADDLKYFEPDVENKTDIPESIEKVKANDKELKDLNLNNIHDIKEEQFLELFDAFNFGPNQFQLPNELHTKDKLAAWSYIHGVQNFIQLCMI